MNIAFESSSLEELYTTGKTSDRLYKRLPQDIIKRFIKSELHQGGAQVRRPVFNQVATL